MPCLALILVAWLLAWPVAASAAPAASLPTFPPKTTYSQARAALVQQGFKPVTPPYPAPTRCDEWAQYCATYPEFVGCFASTWLACEFLWRSPAGVLVAVDTEMSDTPSARNPWIQRIYPMEAEQVRPLFTPRPDLPRIRMHTPYDEVRRRMIAAGYHPYPVKVRDPADNDCSLGRLCQTNPELIHCIPTGVSFCTWLFRRNTDGRFVTVLTDGDPPKMMQYNDAWLSRSDELDQALGRHAADHPRKRHR